MIFDREREHWVATAFKMIISSIVVYSLISCIGSYVFAANISKNIVIKAPVDKLAAEIDLLFQKIILCLQGDIKMGTIKVKSINFETENTFSGMKYSEGDEELLFFIKGVQVGHIDNTGQYVDDVP